MVHRLVVTFSGFFLVVALYCSLSNMGFIDISVLNNYQFGFLTDFSSRLRSWSSVLQAVSKSLDVKAMMGISADNSAWYTVILDGINFLIKAVVYLPSFCLLGSSIVVDLLNNICACIGLFYSTAFGANSNGGIWKSAWDSWQLV